MPQTAPARNHPAPPHFDFPFFIRTRYDAHMKVILLTVFLVGLGFAFVGCESELPPSGEAGHRLQRGIRGEGTLTQPDRSEDPLIKENTRVGY
jgi:hypothetical protein